MKTGKDIHISSSDIAMYLRDDLTLMKKMRSYKGIRHELGQPVRGQRTRSTFRTNKSVGVVRKKAMATAKPREDKK
jgi:small subunit ribosomal protein S13